MKKLFTLDDFMVAFVSALGYGFGETIAKLSGWSTIMCMVASFALGIVLEEIISNIVYSKDVQKNRNKRDMIFVAIFLFFMAAQWVSSKWMGVSMFEYVHEEFVFVIVLPVAGFIMNLLIRAYRVRKIINIYGDGSKGYVFDLEKEDIEEANRQNQPILGSYDADLAVKTRTGIYVGEKNNNIISYMGIPYANPPVGSLRWKAPKPLPPSDAVFEAKNFGASAIQVEHKGAILKNYRQSEDCLYLNICTGSEKTEKLKPVLVVFHHGDFTYGGAADPLLYGDNYIENNPDTVFVSFNYRLGIFGFIDFSEVSGGNAFPDASNLGILDQIAALRWIKENIAAFGGNPDMITVIGFESGATSICLLASSSQAKGLFQKALAFNGNFETVYDTPENSKALAKDLLNETKAQTMEELLKLDTETLKDAAQRLWHDMCAPTCDGKLIPTDIYQAFKEGTASGIEFIIGIPLNESKVYRAFIGEQKFEKLIETFMSSIQSVLDESIAAAVDEFIKTRTAASSELEAKSELLDQWIAICIYLTALKLSEGGNKVHLMYWEDEPLIEKLGLGTVDAAAALLGNDDALQMYGNLLDVEMSETLQVLLQKFVNGEALKLYPNEIKGIDAFDWKPFPQALIVSDEDISCSKIGNRLKVVNGLFDFAVSS